MKIALIVDMPKMPKNCAECLLHYDYLHCVVFENMSFEPEKFEDLREGYGYTSEYCNYRPPLCPLKPLPKKKSISLKEAIGIKCSCYSDGWNDCLDEILGEEE